MESKVRKISQLAEDVYKSLGSGFPEVVYDRAMQVGLRLQKIKYDSQKVVELKYKDHYVGEGFPDIIVNFGKDKVVVELKAVGAALGAAEEQQLRSYMKLLKIKHGLLINFQSPQKKEGKTALEVKEVEI